MKISYKILFLGVFFISLTLGAVGSFGYEKSSDGGGLRLVDRLFSFDD